MTTSLVLPDTLFYQLKTRATAENRSVSSLVRILLARALAPDTAGG